jgi:hypothetical protein
VNLATDVFPCVPGYPSDEGWPSPSGTIDSVTMTGTVGAIEMGEAPTAAAFTFKATVDQGPGSVLGHFGPDCADNGTRWLDIYHPGGFDCHLADDGTTQWADFAVGDDRLWLSYAPALYTIDAARPCSDLWTMTFDGLDNQSATPSNPPPPSTPGGPVATTPARVGATDAKSQQKITHNTAQQQKWKPQTKRLCLTVTPATAPPPIHEPLLSPLFIVAETTYTVPAAARSVRAITYSEFMPAARKAMAKVDTWRHGTRRSLRTLKRVDKTSVRIRATWQARGKHPKRYAALVAVRKTLRGVTARLGHITRRH